jgi:hypothetical protein
MNIILPKDQFEFGNIFFMEKKNNMIIQGSFSKIIYSNEWFSMTGLFFPLIIEIDKIETSMNKTIVRYHPYFNNNLLNIQEMAKIEYHIIDLYKTVMNCHKKISIVLSKQLYSGSLKLYRELDRKKNESMISSECSIQEVLGKSGKINAVDDGFDIGLFDDGSPYMNSVHSDELTDDKWSHCVFDDQLRHNKACCDLLSEENIDTKGLKRYIVKISGIWETTDDVGITYKIFQARPVDVM